MQKVVFIFLTLLTACQQASLERITDNRGNDPQILNKDPLVKIGDIGIENDATPLGPLIQHHFDWDYYNIHPVFPNPTIKPLRGGYVENVIATGRKYLGTPYEYGSDRSTPTTFDCSDFTRWVHLYSLGMDLPKDSRSQAQYIRLYSKRHYTDIRKARRGDLLFFMPYLGPEKEKYLGIDVKKQTISHCGIYLGKGKMLHTASAQTGGVRIDRIAGMHYQWRFIMGGNVLPSPGQGN